MQYFRTKRRKLRSLVEPDTLDQPGIWDHTRVGGHHPIHVGPYLDRVGTQCGAHQRGAVVRAAATERRRDTGTCPADEPPEDWDAAVAQ